MINEKEIRIGNWFMGQHIPFEWTVEDFTQVYQSEAKPIPLTEQWLIDFRFEKLREISFEKKFNVARIFTIVLHKQSNSFTFPAQNGITTIEYVHQLQNLYFALTGNELQIK